MDDFTTQAQRIDAELRRRTETWAASVTHLLMELGVAAGMHADVQKMVDAYNEAFSAAWSID